MPILSEIITAERTRCFISAPSKKKALELIAEILATSHPSLRSQEVFDALITRERLGTTGIGHGVAIPHAHLETLDQPLGSLIILKNSIDFDAPDQVRVDMLFALIAPSQADTLHLELLSALARFFHEENNRTYLHQASSSLDLYQRFIHASRSL